MNPSEPEPSQLRVVLATAPDETLARELARTLVDERLAACVNVVPGLHSVYRWEGDVTEDDEVLLIAKTRADRVEALAARLCALHPYAVPEVLALAAAGGSAAYLAWVARESVEDPR